VNSAIVGQVVSLVPRFILYYNFFFFFQAEDGIRDFHVTGVQTCALPIYHVTQLRDTTSKASIFWRTRPSASGVHVARNATTSSGATTSSVPSMCISPASLSAPVRSISVPPEPTHTCRHCPRLGTKKLKIGRA